LDRISAEEEVSDKEKSLVKQVLNHWIRNATEHIYDNEIDKVALIKQFMDNSTSRKVFDSKTTLNGEMLQPFISAIKGIYARKCVMLHPEHRITACGGRDNYQWINMNDFYSESSASHGTVISQTLLRYGQEDDVIFYRGPDSSIYTYNDVTEALSPTISEAAKSCNLPHYRLSHYHISGGHVSWNL
jgi:hypothetical protein